MSNVWRARYVMATCCLCAPMFCSAAAVQSGRSESTVSENSPIDGGITLGVLSGTVSDPSKAKLVDAHVEVQGGSIKREVTTDDHGRFSLPLPTGRYTVSVTADGFRRSNSTVTLTASSGHVHIDVTLAIDAKEEQVTVASDEDDTSAAENKSAMVFKGDQLKTFSDDDSTFEQEILALAGGTGQKPPEILVDGFSNGRFPPKNTIREIRINRNPYSAQYDQPGFGRVEVFTKPGADKLHGEFSSFGTDNVFNARNPYSPVQPPYYNFYLQGNLSGAINKKTSLFGSADYNDAQNNAIVDAIDPVLLGPLAEAVPAPQITQDYSLRLDRQVTAKNTLTGKYAYNRAHLQNSGVGLLVLPTEGLNSTTGTQTFQITDTQVIGTKIISEAHFQYLRTRLEQSPASSAATVVVQGVFNGGGSAAQAVSDNQDRYEFQEFLSIDHKSHFVRVGGRYRLLRDSNSSTSNYNGQFIFPDLATYKLALAGETPAQIFANSGGASGAIQYSLTAGEARATVLTGDLGVFVEDEWKLRKNLTLDLGFRLESQSGVPDHFDPAPRAGFAWAISGKKKSPIVTLRGGGGLFYDRFASTDLLTAIRRQSGTSQPSYFVNNPNFFQQYLTTPAPIASLGATPPTLYNVDPHLRTQVDATAGISAERRIGKIGSISFNYIYIHSNHQYLSRNINAPLPGTYDPANPSSGVRPLGGTQNIYQFSSDGIGRSHILYTSGNINASKRASFFMFGFYSPSQKNDAPSSTSFPTNQYNPSADYGRQMSPSAQLFSGGQFHLPYGMDMSLYTSVQNGTPFNITTGTDLNGDTIYNDRPAFATRPTAKSILYKTRFGTFDANPQPGEQIIPINYGNSPNFFFIETDLGRSFKFGPRPVAAAPALVPGAAKTAAPKPDPPYALSFSVEVNNLLNHNNPGSPVGVLSSPLFGQSISLNSPFSIGGIGTSANRTVTLRYNFSF